MDAPQILTLPSRAPADVPVIETPRLRLRLCRITDLDDLAAMWADETYVRFIGRRIRPRSEVWKTLQSTCGSWLLLGYGYWLIETLDTGAFVGECGFLEGVRPVDPPHIGVPEAGWGIAPEHWGKGFASEALAGALGWADTVFPEKRSVCMIEPDHTASIRVAEKNGFVAAYDTRIGDDPIRIFERIGT